MVFGYLSGACHHLVIPTLDALRKVIVELNVFFLPGTMTQQLHKSPGLR